MRNQFFYTRTEKSPKEGEPDKTFEDSFCPDFVLRSVLRDDGTRLVLLNDIHERLQDAPQFDKTRTKVVGYTKQRNTFQSEITLIPADSERFKKLTNIE